MRKSLVLSIIVLSGLLPPQLSASQAKKWTSIVYIAGDNSLSRYVDYSIELMKQAANSSEHNILVLADKTTEYLDVTSSTLKCYKISHLSSTTIPLASINPSWSESNANLGDPAYLVNFATYCVKEYPAEKYLLVIWSHGTGWWPKSPAQKAIAYDEHNPTDDKDYITTEELGNALEQIKNYIGAKIDVVGADACLMAQIEIAYQFRNSVRYFVASQELTPAHGWRYDRIFDWLSKNPSASAEDVAKKIADAFEEAYGSVNPLLFEDPRRAFSVIDVSNIETLAQKVKNFSDELQKTLRLPLLFLARDKSERFGAGANEAKYSSVDLYDFAYLIHNTRDWRMPALTEAAANVMSEISKTVIYRKIGPNHPNARGISINFPKTRNDYLIHNNPSGNYETLAFSQDTGWNKFLQFYTEQIPVFAVTNINYVTAAPSPFNPKKSPLKFQNFPTDTTNLTIKIYTLSGELVRIINEENTETFIDEGYAIWDGKNESGKEVATGVYFYRGNSNYGAFKGRICLVKE